MNKKNIAIIIGILVIVIAIIGIIFVNVKSNNNIKKDNNTNVTNIKDDTETKTNKEYDSIDDLPKYNNYNYYEMKDAVNQSWFSKIGEVGKVKQGGPTSSRYNYADVILGYDSKNKKEYLYPDAIILQGKNGEKGYEQTIIKREQYDVDDGYEFFENALKIAKYEDTQIKEQKEKVFKLTDKDIESNLLMINAIGAENAQETINEISSEHYNKVQKQIPWALYNNMREQDMKMRFDLLEKPNEMSDIISYFLQLDSQCGDQYGNFRIILVYDELKANINICYSKNDDVKYYADFMYYSGIINQTAYEKVKEKLDY